MHVQSDDIDPLVHDEVVDATGSRGAFGPHSGLNPLALPTFRCKHFSVRILLLMNHNVSHV